MELTQAIELKYLVVLIIVHFVSDFLMQTDKMALNKSTSNKWLTYHIFVYSVLSFFLFGPLYAGVNAALHWVTDFISSRVMTKLWKAEKRKWFFAVLGADQAAHMLAMVLTFGLAHPLF